jgi:hypothetical protein
VSADRAANGGRLAVATGYYRLLAVAHVNDGQQKGRLEAGLFVLLLLPTS